MAGVVHIITSPDNVETGFGASIEAGSFATTRSTLTGRYSGGKHQLQFSADYLDTDGTNISRQGSEEDGLDNLTLSLSGRYAASENLDLTYTVRHTDKTTEFDGVDFFLTGLPADADNETRSEYLYAGMNLAHVINETLDHSLSLARTESDNKTLPTGEVARGTRDAIRYQVNVTGESHHLSVRAERESEDFRQRGAASFFGDPNQDRDIDTTSIAAEYRYHQNGLNLSLSGRHDNNSDFRDASSWRATGNFRAGETILFASIGESVKNPTFTERFGFFTNFIGNPDLEPEQSLHWEVGARRSFFDNRLKLSLAWFEADLDNEINGFVFDFASGGFTSANIDGESHREGAELMLNYQVSERLNLNASYTYLDATEEEPAGNDVTEVRRPRHSGSMTVDYDFTDAGLSLAISRTGTQEDDYFPPYPPYRERVSLSGFTLVELSGYYRLSESITLTARVENALDERYEQVFGFESPGAAGYVGVSLNW